MKSEILEKLRKEFEAGISTESQAVYVLSRIRKYLEGEGSKLKYKHLNFYCNWALHDKIQKTLPVAGMLEDFKTGRNIDDFLYFKPLINELRKFIQDNGLPAKLIDDSASNRIFMNLLVEIYTDTPLILSSADGLWEIRIIRSKVVTKGGVYSIYCTATPILSGGKAFGHTVYREDFQRNNQ